LSWVETLVNLVLSVVPIALTVAMITTEMPAAIRPYSIAVAPDSWTTGLSNFPPSSKRAKSARRHDGRTFQTTVRSPHSTFVGGAEPNSGLVGFALENRLLRRTPSCLLRAKSGRFEIGCQFALNSIGPLDRWPRLQVPGRLAPTKDDSCGRPGCLGSPWSGYQGPASFVGSEPPRSHVPLGAYHLAR